MFFDDWNENFSILNSLTVDSEDEAKLEFFNNKKSYN